MIDADVRLRVTADTAEADRRIEKTGDKLAAAGNGNAGPAAGAFSPGKLLGALAGGWAGGEILGLAQGMAHFTPGMTDLSPGGQRRSNRIGAVGGGAVSGAMAGAAIGSILPGVGTAIGAAVGLVAGALTGLAKTIMAEKKEFFELRNQLQGQVESIADNQMMGASDRAFDKINARKTRPDQLTAVKMRRQLVYNELHRTQGRLLEMKDSGTDDTPEFGRLSNIRAQQAAQLTALVRKDEDLSQPILGKHLKGSEALDTLGRMGGTVGPTVDVDAVNRDQLRLEELQLQTLKEIAKSLSADRIVNESGAVFI